MKQYVNPNMHVVHLHGADGAEVHVQPWARQNRVVKGSEATFILSGDQWEKYVETGHLRLLEPVAAETVKEVASATKPEPTPEPEAPKEEKVEEPVADEETDESKPKRKKRK